MRSVKKSARKEVWDWIPQPTYQRLGLHDLKLEHGPWREGQEGGKEGRRLHCARCGKAARSVGGWTRFAGSTCPNLEGARVVKTVHAMEGSKGCGRCVKLMTAKSRLGACGRRALLDGHGNEVMEARGKLDWAAKAAKRWRCWQQSNPNEGSAGPYRGTGLEEPAGGGRGLRWKNHSLVQGGGSVCCADCGKFGNDGRSEWRFKPCGGVVQTLPLPLRRLVAAGTFDEGLGKAVALAQLKLVEGSLASASDHSERPLFAPR